MSRPKWRDTLDENCEPLSKSNSTNLLYIQASEKCNKEKREIDNLQQLLNKCNANFTAPPPMPVPVPAPAPIKEGFASLQEQQISPYDIRKHKQYKQLIDSIKSEYILTKRKAAAAETGPKCVPYDTTDIRKHKDYPKMVQYIYEMAAKKCSDIKTNPDYAKIVRAVQRKTMMEYGQQTASGQYVKCPSSAASNNSSIQQHPQYAQLVQSIVKKTIREYGEPIPGSSPVEFRRCSPLNTQCVQKFSIPAQENFISGSNIDPFDIRNHTQYRQMLMDMEQQCKKKVEQDMNISNYVLKSSLSPSCLPGAAAATAATAATAAAVKEGFADLKETTTKMLKLKVLDTPATKVVTEIHNDLVAVEKGEKKVSDLRTSPPLAATTTTAATTTAATTTTVPVIVSDLQQMLQSTVQIAQNQKEMKKTQKHIEEMLKKAPKNNHNSNNNSNNNNKLEAAKTHMDNLAFQNARLREELQTLRRMCNERIVNLWNEGHGLRQELDTKQRRLSAQQYIPHIPHYTNTHTHTNQAQMYNSVAQRYKMELDGLKQYLQSQNVLLARSQGECAQRVERYRQMYERTVVLLDELRTKGPAMVDQIHRLKNILTKHVNRAVGNVAKPATDTQLINQMTNVGHEMSSIENNIGTTRYASV